jgi:hypothetical protein
VNIRMLCALLFAYGALFISAIVTGHHIYLFAALALTVSALGGLGLHSFVARRRSR